MGPGDDIHARAHSLAQHAVIGLLLLTVLVGSGPNSAQGTATPPTVRATAAVLMDARTGRVLYALAPHLRWPPASTTKMLTAMVVVKSLPEDRAIPISPRASAERSGTAIGLEIGEQWKVRDLLRSMLLYSANDAAIALAEGVAGSVEAFAIQMNAAAKAIGARESHFAVPHGLYDRDHYSTAYDLALIARTALQQRQIAEVVRMQTWDLQRPYQPSRLVINLNKLLWRYRGADGVKTGWIPQSGPILVASATRQGWQLIAVLINDSRMYTDATALLDYGFNNFVLTKVAEQGEVVGDNSVIDGTSPLVAQVPDDVYAVVRQGEPVAREVVIASPTAPVPRAAVIGHAFFRSEGTVVAETLLVAEDSVPARSVWARLITWVHKTFEEWL